MAVGLSYFPMALVAVTLFDGVAGLNPFLVVSSIVKIIPAYLVACVLLAVVFAAYILVLRAFLLPISFLARNAISIYLLMVEMRILGLLYRAYEKRLGWFTKNKTDLLDLT
ncbi:MAG: hypothetical protein QF577_09360 [Phycisphaerae bacterium]|nr:hypothetical protein [Phycisphaerae bacterium]MDP7637738.1 hypothetical protein [Phycisphaerae bacterium]